MLGITRTYFRFWFWFDLGSFLLSLGLILGYIIYGHRVLNSFQDLWGNFAIEILSIWISVRIFSRIFKWFESVSQYRYNLLESLNKIEQLGDITLWQSCSLRTINKLETEINRFVAVRKNGIKYLSRKELELLKGFDVELEVLFSQCKLLTYQIIYKCPSPEDIEKSKERLSFSLMIFADQLKRLTDLFEKNS